jgi:hypothetical protein
VKRKRASRIVPSTPATGRPPAIPAKRWAESSLTGTRETTISPSSTESTLACSIELFWSPANVAVEEP